MKKNFGNMSLAILEVVDSRRYQKKIVKDSLYWDLPYAVYYAKKDSARIEKKRVEYKREAFILQQISNSLETQFDESVIIYNSDTTKFLIQIAVPEDKNWILDYYYFDFLENSLYLWLDEPSKRIEDLDDCRLYFERDIAKKTPFIFAGFDHRRDNEKIWNLFTKNNLRKIN